MAKLVRRYSVNARAFIENVYKFCMEQKSLEWNCHWILYGTVLQHSLALADLQLRKLWTQDEQQQPKQQPSSTSKVSLDDFDQGVVRDHRKRVLIEVGSVNLW